MARAMASENATLRAEHAAMAAQNAAMQAELAALSPQFFEEVEDLRYAYSVARQHLQSYEARYGPPPQ